MDNCSGVALPEGATSIIVDNVDNYVDNVDNVDNYVDNCSGVALPEGGMWITGT